MLSELGPTQLYSQGARRSEDRSHEAMERVQGHRLRALGYVPVSGTEIQTKYSNPGLSFWSSAALTAASARRLQKDAKIPGPSFKKKKEKSKNERYVDFVDFNVPDVGSNAANGAAAASAMPATAASQSSKPGQDGAQDQKVQR